MAFMTFAWRFFYASLFIVALKLYQCFDCVIIGSDCY